MLSRLLKHEFSATWKVPVALDLLLIVLGVIGAISLGNIPSAKDSVGLAIMTFLLTAIYYVGIIAANIVTMVYLVMRYYKNLYTSQGYLTFTLPVRTDQIITSKAISGSFWMLCCFVCTILSVLIASIGIISRINIPAEDFQEIFSELVRTTGFFTPSFTLTMIFTIVVSAIAGVLSLYFCVTVGQLWAKHKILGAVLCYIAVYIFNQMVSTITLFTSGFFGVAERTGSEIDATFAGVYNHMLLTLSIIVLIEAVIYYVSCLLITRKKVNLD